MANQNPTFRIIISGSGVTGLDETTSIELKNKVEESYTIVDTDGVVTLNFDNIENMKALIFDGNGDFTVTFTSGANTLEFPCGSGIPMTFPATQTFVDGLDSISISTLSTEDIQIQVRAYGEVVT